LLPILPACSVCIIPLHGGESIALPPPKSFSCRHSFSRRDVPKDWSCTWIDVDISPPQLRSSFFSSSRDGTTSLPFVPPLFFFPPQCASVLSGLETLTRDVPNASAVLCVPLARLLPPDIFFHSPQAALQNFPFFETGFPRISLRLSMGRHFCKLFTSSLWCAFSSSFGRVPLVPTFRVGDKFYGHFIYFGRRGGLPTSCRLFSFSNFRKFAIFSKLVSFSFRRLPFPCSRKDGTFKASHFEPDPGSPLIWRVISSRSPCMMAQVDRLDFPLSASPLFRWSNPKGPTFFLCLRL